MGWDCVKSYASAQKMLRNETRCPEVVAQNFVPRSKSTYGESDELYTACKTNKGIVGWVSLGERKTIRGSRNYCVKIMGEREHPNYYNASKEVLNALSTCSEDMLKWREKVREKLGLE